MATLDKLAFDDFKNKYEDLIALVRYFRSSEIVGAVGSTLANFIPESELLDTCEAILFSCRWLGGITAIYDEYVKRIGDLEEAAIPLSSFLVDHPGIQHKAGVPSGGTFILVYHEDPAPSGTFGVPIFVEQQPDLTILGAASDVESSPGTRRCRRRPARAVPAAPPCARKRSRRRERRLSRRRSRSPARRVHACRRPPTHQRQPHAGGSIPISALQLGDRSAVSRSCAARRVPGVGSSDDPVSAIIAKAVAELGDQAIIADFFLPYQISCDCPACQYVLPKPLPSFTTQVGCHHRRQHRARHRHGQGAACRPTTSRSMPAPTARLAAIRCCSRGAATR